MGTPAYSRLQVDERRRQLLDAGARLFTDEAFEAVSMRQIADAAGVSKALLYHYFPSKSELFKAAVAEKAEELQRLIEPHEDGAPPLEQLASSIQAYLAWIEENSQAWSKLVQSAATVPEAMELVEAFRQRTLDMVLVALTGGGPPPPALRTALRGWLGYMDAAILDWLPARDLERATLRDLLLAAFGASLLAAQQADPALHLDLG